MNALSIQISCDPSSYERNFCNCVYGSLKNFNVVWTLGLPKPVWRSNQMSCEATDVGNWWFVGSHELVSNEWMLKWYMTYFLYWAADVKSNELWFSELWTQFFRLPFAIAKLAFITARINIWYSSSDHSKHLGIALYIRYHSLRNLNPHYVTQPTENKLYNDQH